LETKELAPIRLEIRVGLFPGDHPNDSARQRGHGADKQIAGVGPDRLYPKLD